MNNETKVKKGFLYWLILSGYIVTIPFLFISFMVFLGSFLVFRAEFSIENKTETTITVTPIGTVGKEGNRCLIPILSGRYFSFISSKWGGFILAPGESVSIIYDHDDINFSEIVVEHGSEKSGMLITDPEPTKNQYHTPYQSKYSISDLDALEEVPENIRKLALSAHNPIPLQKLFIFLIVFPWIVFFILNRINRKYTRVLMVNRPVQKKTES